MQYEPAIPQEELVFHLLMENEWANDADLKCFFLDSFLDEIMTYVTVEELYSLSNIETLAKLKVDLIQPPDFNQPHQFKLFLGFLLKEDPSLRRWGTLSSRAKIAMSRTTDRNEQIKNMNALQIALGPISNSPSRFEKLIRHSGMGYGEIVLPFLTDKKNKVAIQNKWSAPVPSAL